MYEFEVEFKGGKRDFLFGYSLKNACERRDINLLDIKVIHIEYID